MQNAFSFGVLLKQTGSKLLGVRTVIRKRAGLLFKHVVLLIGFIIQLMLQG